MSEAAPPMLSVRSIGCCYGDDVAVADVSFELRVGGLACLLGPSGCGKTSVLRLIAGFLSPVHGEIYLDGALISTPERILPPERRNLGMVFQEHALFPHLTVEKNVCAGLFRLPRQRRLQISGELLERVGLAHCRHRYPHELSGGQQQRVALARALAPGPRLLLMDEPFSSLERDLRARLGREVRDIVKDFGTTCLMVTHDQQDAFTFAEQVGVMREGRIEQWDTPYAVYHQPNSQFVADFVGDGVFLRGTITPNGGVETELATLYSPNLSQFEPGQPVLLLVRPDDIVHDDDSPRTARIKQRTFRGESYLYTLELPSGGEILATVPSHHDHSAGEDLGIVLNLDHVVAFPISAAG